MNSSGDAQSASQRVEGLNDSVPTFLVRLRNRKLRAALLEMPRYFFNVMIGKQEPIADPEGDLLPGDAAARRHAKAVARDMLSNRRLYTRGLDRWVFVVTDQRGRLVARVPFKSCG